MVLDPMNYFVIQTYCSHCCEYNGLAGEGGRRRRCTQNIQTHTDILTQTHTTPTHTGLCFSFIAGNVCWYDCAYYYRLSNNNHTKTKMNYCLTINHFVDQRANVHHWSSNINVERNAMHKGSVGIDFHLHLVPSPWEGARICHTNNSQIYQGKYRTDAPARLYHKHYLVRLFHDNINYNMFYRTHTVSLTAHERVLDFQKVKCDTIASSIITSIFYFPFHLPPSPLSMSNVGWVTFSIFHTADQQTSKRRPDFL